MNLMSTRNKSNPDASDQRRRAAASADGQRLQKVLAAAGIGSRRQCEQLIEEGRVEVDRQVVAILGTRVDPSRQEIRVDGRTVRRPKRIYLLVHKPPGVISTSRDPAGRLRVVDLVATDQRLFTVGRLDKSSEGLILVTNDGELANRLLHPRYQVERTYQVVVAGEPTREAIDALRRGVHLAEGRVRVARLRIRHRRKRSTVLEMVLTEGRNREIRRMAARIGHKVMSLKRVGFGPLRLGDLPPGAYRELTRAELQRLRDLPRRRAGGTTSRPSSPERHSRGRAQGNRTQQMRKPASRTRQTRGGPRPKGSRR